MTIGRLARRILCSCLVGFAGCNREAINEELLQPIEEPSWPSLSEAAEPLAQPRTSDAAVIVGIADYTRLSRVSGADVNASDWQVFLTNTLGIPTQNVRLLRDDEATKSNIEEAVREMAQKAGEGGFVWFIYIGHGTASPERDSEALLLDVDTQKKANSLMSNGISQSWLLATLEQSKGLPIVVLDACFTGEVYNEETNSSQELVSNLQPVSLVDIVHTNKALVFAAAQGEEVAGPLKSAPRPAFSYLMLGALRGWADENHDKRVTVGEAVNYAKNVLEAVLTDRDQTPALLGNAMTSMVLVDGVAEVGPDIAAIQRSESVRSEFEVEGQLITPPPTVDSLEAVVVELAGINMDAERAFERAVKIENDYEALPEEKASVWCELARMADASNPYRVNALKQCHGWQVYAKELRRQEKSMARDYDKLRQYVDLSHKNNEQKIAALTDFLNGYTSLSPLGYPHIKEAIEARTRLHAGKEVVMPSLIEVPLGPDAWSLAQEGTDTWECANGTRIEAKYKCDMVNDCADGSDELGCPGSTNVAPPPQPASTWTCANGATIPAEYRCDATQGDCIDGSDEVGCPGATGPGPKIDTCANGEKVLAKYWCDSVQDCSDGSDESSCWTCTDGGKIRGEYRCDKVEGDCVDYSDEANCDVVPSGM